MRGTGRAQSNNVKYILKIGGENDEHGSLSRASEKTWTRTRGRKSRAGSHFVLGIMSGRSGGRNRRIGVLREKNPQTGGEGRVKRRQGKIRGVMGLPRGRTRGKKSLWHQRRGSSREVIEPSLV